MKRLAVVGGILGVIVTVAGLLWRVWPVRVRPSGEPATSYADALEKVAALRRRDGSNINPVCHTRLYTHGHKTDEAYVLLHGFTNCPQQFSQLAETLYRAGNNVLVPREPLHGAKERKPTNLGQMTPESVGEFMHVVVDAAQGLGNRVTILGFSFGAVMAAWVALQREDIHELVLVSPSFGLGAFKRWQSRVLANLMAWLPDSFRYWDPEAKEAREGPQHAYVGFSTRAVGTILRLSELVLQESRRRAPGVQNILIVTNPNDEVVNNQTARTIEMNWRGNGASVHTYAFPAELGLIHDLMDPDQPRQKVHLAYPLLLAAIQDMKEPV